MIRHWFYILLLALPLVVGCAQTSITTVPEYTLRDPGMNYMQFLYKAEALIAENFPEWYVEDVKRELVFDNPDMRFASVSKEEDGTFIMHIFEMSWDLCTVEDLASVLLHEYVHIKIWDDLLDQIPGDTAPANWCRAAVHEMTAYGTELQQRKVNVTAAMRMSTRMGYIMSYERGHVFCSSEIMEGFSHPEAMP